MSTIYWMFVCMFCSKIGHEVLRLSLHFAVPDQSPDSTEFSWLGIQDSNLGQRIQSPLSYR